MQPWQIHIPMNSGKSVFGTGMVFPFLSFCCQIYFPFLARAHNIIPHHTCGLGELLEQTVKD
eukprot:961920-Amphidinium_carterae.1